MGDTLVLALAIIIGCNFIKDGLINFSSRKDDDYPDTFLVDEDYMKMKLGVSSKELEEFLQKNTEIKSMTLNNKTYYIRKSFDDYINNL